MHHASSTATGLCSRLARELVVLGRVDRATHRVLPQWMPSGGHSPTQQLHSYLRSGFVGTALHAGASSPPGVRRACPTPTQLQPAVARYGSKRPSTGPRHPLRIRRTRAGTAVASPLWSLCPRGRPRSRALPEVLLLKALQAHVVRLPCAATVPASEACRTSPDLAGQWAIGPPQTQRGSASVLSQACPSSLPAWQLGAVTSGWRQCHLARQGAPWTT
jgi:hypothetical protein